MTDRRTRLQRAMGGERRTIRAEQMRAVGYTDRAIARALDVPIDALRRWFELQDHLLLSDDADGAA